MIGNLTRAEWYPETQECLVSAAGFLYKPCYRTMAIKRMIENRKERVMGFILRHSFTAYIVNPFL